jgi:citronellol/citronellal dehydrogenase
MRICVADGTFLDTPPAHDSRCSQQQMGTPAPFNSVLRADANVGRVALVTGGGTGIGAATAFELAATGAAAVICGRRERPLRDTAERIRAAGGECLPLAADIREPDDVTALLDAALERFGRIDVLVNNAGGQFAAPAEQITDSGWHAVQRLAVEGSWRVTRAVATRAMIPGSGGLIVFVGFSPLRGSPGFAHASAARSTPMFLASPAGAYITGTTIAIDGGVDAWGLGELPPPPR